MGAEAVSIPIEFNSLTVKIRGLPLLKYKPSEDTLVVSPFLNSSSKAFNFTGSFISNALNNSSVNGIFSPASLVITGFLPAILSLQRILSYELASTLYAIAKS